VKEMEYVWHLRAKMAERGMFATTDLQPLLAEPRADIPARDGSAAASQHGDSDRAVRHP
jgi:hypothetical protein